MAVQKSSSLVRLAGLAAVAGAVALLGGCVVAPVDGYGYDTGAPVVYPSATYYETPNYYYGGSPYYYSRPYYGPAFSLGVYGSSSDRHRWRGNDGWRGNNGWRGNGGRGNWNHPGVGPRPPGVMPPRPPRPPSPGAGVPRPPPVIGGHRGVNNWGPGNRGVRPFDAP